MLSKIKQNVINYLYFLFYQINFFGFFFVIMFPLFLSVLLMVLYVQCPDYFGIPIVKIFILDLSTKIGNLKLGLANITKCIFISMIALLPIYTQKEERLNKKHKLIEYEGLFFRIVLVLGFYYMIYNFPAYFEQITRSAFSGCPSILSN